jgi:hypothetical protein
MRGPYLSKRRWCLKTAAWFQIAVGVLMVAVWAGLLTVGEVEEIEAGQIDIWFHLTAELLTAALLFAGGVALLRLACSCYSPRSRCSYSSASSGRRATRSSNGKPVPAAPGR